VAKYYRPEMKMSIDSERFLPLEVNEITETLNMANKLMNSDLKIIKDLEQDMSISRSKLFRGWTIKSKGKHVINIPYAEVEGVLTKDEVLKRIRATKEKLLKDSERLNKLKIRLEELKRKFGIES
jgi:hypothetical protein